MFMTFGGCQKPEYFAIEGVTCCSTFEETGEGCIKLYKRRSRAGSSEQGAGSSEQGVGSKEKGARSSKQGAVSKE